MRIATPKRIQPLILPARKTPDRNPINYATRISRAKLHCGSKVLGFGASMDFITLEIKIKIHV